MQLEHLWALRLGFSTKQAAKIKEKSIEGFLQDTYSAPFEVDFPDFLSDEPKTLSERRERNKMYREISREERQMYRRENRRTFRKMKSWWVNRMRNSEHPLLEKMTCFWHNHFVASWKKVQENYWIYEHYRILRENAFGNYRELTKQIVRSNAMIKYLDNQNNKNGKFNENLSRELLELFTLGIGHYSEEDIKNGAKALAGLGFGNNGMGVYRKKIAYHQPINYLGKTGVFRLDDLIDIIFEQQNTPYFITEKILKWFVYDDPEKSLIKYYGDYLKSVDFELAPFFTKIVTEEYDKPNAGRKIKDPLVYMLQLVDELHAEEVDNTTIATFLSRQGMDLFNQPNVKGWEGGNSWLTSQLFIQRNKMANTLSMGKYYLNNPSAPKQNGIQQIEIALNWNPKSNSRQIIEDIASRTLFRVDDTLENDMESILPYDFDPQKDNADKAVLRLFRYIVQTPEYQLI